MLRMVERSLMMMKESMRLQTVKNPAVVKREKLKLQHNPLLKEILEISWDLCLLRKKR